MSNIIKLNSSFNELPFFCNDNLKVYYRVEASIFNFSYEKKYRSFSVDFYMGTKLRNQLLMPMFMDFKNINLYNPYKFRNYKYLFENSFSLVVINSNSGNFYFNKNTDYFPTIHSKDIIKSLFDISSNLSDVSLDALKMRNRFHRILNNSSIDFDTFISSFNSRWNTVFESDTFGYKSNVKLPI